MTDTPAPATAPSDFWTGAEAGAHAMGTFLAGVLDPTTRSLTAQALESLFSNTLAPKLDSATADALGRAVGGLIGHLATPGIENTEHVLETQIETDLIDPLAGAAQGGTSS